MSMKQREEQRECPVINVASLRESRVGLEEGSSIGLDKKGTSLAFT